VWQGQRVTEVELTDRDGKNYEVLFSSTGEILHVEEEKGLPWIGGELSLGLAMRGEREIFRGVGTEIEPSLFFMYENGRLEILAYDGIDATFRLLGNDWLSLGISGSLLVEEGYDPDASDFFEGMDEIGTPYNAGLQLEAVWGAWEVNLEVNQDISGEHDGQGIELRLIHTMSFAGFELRPELAFTWMSVDTVNYFYGVSEVEARPGRPAYSPGSSFEVGAEVMVQRDLGAGFSVLGLVGVSTVDDAIKDSPLVDGRTGIEGAFGVMYSF